jgi:hypothetical protein
MVAESARAPRIKISPVVADGAAGYVVEVDGPLDLATVAALRASSIGSPSGGRRGSSSI